MTEVTTAEPRHANAIVSLAEEMDRFYGTTEIEPRSIRLRQLDDALFSDNPSAYALLAWNDSDLIGFAAYSFLWPAIGLTRSLYLKELYVSQSVRRKGIGKLLMDGLYEVAVENNCTRIEWTTDQENTDAQNFYADLGVSVNTSKLFYRLEIDQSPQKI